jgi:hypothetical protein
MTTLRKFVIPRAPVDLATANRAPEALASKDARHFARPKICWSPYQFSSSNLGCSPPYQASKKFKKGLIQANLGNEVLVCTLAHRTRRSSTVFGPRLPIREPNSENWLYLNSQNKAS